MKRPYGSLFRILAIVGAVGVVLGLPEVVAAASCGNTKTLLISCSNSENGIYGIVLTVISIMTMGVGLVAIGGFVYGAILYASAQNNASQVTKAKETIFNVVLGIAVFSLMFSFLQFLIPGGVFNRSLKSPAPSSAPVGTLPDEEEDTSDPADDTTGDGSDDSAGGDITGIRGVKNSRDASGGVLTEGTLYRSGHLGNITKASRSELASLLGKKGIIIDLRTPDKIAENPDKPIPGVKRVSIPIEPIEDQAPMVTDRVRRAQIKKVLTLMARTKGNVLVHCHGGKDRTGWIVAMVMHINGASRDEIMTEYMKSEEAWPGRVKEKWLNSGYTAIARNYRGSIDYYLKNGVGLSDPDINALKNKF